MARRSTASAPPAEGAPEGAEPATPGGEGPGEAGEVPGEAGTASAPHPDPAPPESGFFTWLRGLGVQRQNGWLGGVCGGIAARIGVDPLLVRGIAVVLAIAGAPVALLYAAAWFLLPDAHGVIHAQQLGHGRVTRALPGIVAVFLASFLPLTQVFWWGGALYWGDLGWGGAVGRIVWTGVLLVAVIVLVVWLARRAAPAVTMVPATSAAAAASDGGESGAAMSADTADAMSAPGDAAYAAGAAGAAPAEPGAASDPGEPPAPPADASAEELAAWKESQDAWQKQRAAWAAEQRRSERERRQAEAYARAVEASEQAKERARIRRLTRPRASAGVVFLVLGVALVASALAAYLASSAEATRGAEWMIGAAVLVLVLGVGTVAVALGRRRSGALAFFSILSVPLLVVAVLVPTDRQLLAPWAGTGLDAVNGGRYAQLEGTTYVYVQDLRGEEAAGGDAPVIDLWQLHGFVNIDLAEGATVRVDVRAANPGSTVEVTQSWAEGGSSSSFPITPTLRSITIGPGEPDVVVRVDIAQSAWVLVSAESWSDTVPMSPASQDVATWQYEGDGSSVAVPGDELGDELHELTPTPIPEESDGHAGVDEGATP